MLHDALHGIVLAILIVAAAVLGAHAATPPADRWAQADPELRRWFESLKQPDNPSVSCCGSSDAYYVDHIEVVDGKVFATVTDNRGNPLPVGYLIEIPPHKMNRDANKTGRYIAFISPTGNLFCFISGSGV